MPDILLTTKDNKLVNLREDGTWEHVILSESSLDMWRNIKQTPAALEFFRNLFEEVGIRVLDTEEQFTCIQTFSGIEFAEGLDESKVDYTVDVHSYQVERLAKCFQIGDIDQLEQYRIVRSLYAPIASAALNKPMALRFMNNWIISLLINRKRIVHIILLSPDLTQEDHSYFTLLGVSKQWLLLDSHYGRAQRVFTMSHIDVLEMYKKVQITMRTGGWLQWIRFAKWYVSWRQKVENSLYT